MKTINIQNEANIKANGKLSCHRCKPVICIDTGEVFTSATDAAEKAGVHLSVISACCIGKIRTANGKRYCYLSKVTESLDAIFTRLRETSAVEADAKKWQAYQAEQEEKRKAREELEAKIVKVQEKVARRTAVRDTKQNEARIAEERLAEAQRELEALQEMLNGNAQEVA